MKAWMSENWRSVLIVLIVLLSWVIGLSVVIIDAKSTSFETSTKEWCKDTKPAEMGDLRGLCDRIR